jgi:hypothetical protein
MARCWKPSRWSSVSIRWDTRPGRRRAHAGGRVHHRPAQPQQRILPVDRHRLSQRGRYRRRRGGWGRSGRRHLHPRHAAALCAVDDWTAGCIAVTNREMRQIYAMVQDGTPDHHPALTLRRKRSAHARQVPACGMVALYAGRITPVVCDSSVTESAAGQGAIRSDSLAIRRFRWQKHVILGLRRAKAPKKCCLFDDTGRILTFRVRSQDCNRSALLIKRWHEVQSWVP